MLCLRRNLRCPPLRWPLPHSLKVSQQPPRTSEGAATYFLRTHEPYSGCGERDQERRRVRVQGTGAHREYLAVRAYVAASEGRVRASVPRAACGGANGTPAGIQA